MSFPNIVEAIVAGIAVLLIAFCARQILDYLNRRKTRGMIIAFFLNISAGFGILVYEAFGSHGTLWLTIWNIVCALLCFASASRVFLVIVRAIEKQIDKSSDDSAD